MELLGISTYQIESHSDRDREIINSVNDFRSLSITNCDSQCILINNRNFHWKRDFSTKLKLVVVKDVKYSFMLSL